MKIKESTSNMATFKIVRDKLPDNCKYFAISFILYAILFIFETEPFFLFDSNFQSEIEAEV